VAGGVAGLVMAAVMFSLRLALGVPALPELVEDQAIALLPGPLFSLLLDQLQFAGKPLFLVGLAGAQVLAGVLLGCSYGCCWPAHRWRLDRAGLVSGALYGIGVGVLLVLVVTLVGDGPAAAAQSALLLFASAVAYGLALVGAARWLAAPATVPTSTGHLVRLAASHPGRRTLLLGGVAGGALLISGGALARIIAAIGEQATASPEPGAAAGLPEGGLTAAAAEATATSAPALALAPSTAPTATPAPLPVGIAEAITPNDRFYLVSKNFVDPRVRVEGWVLEVSGLLQEPRRFTYDELLGLPASRQVTTFACISNVVGGKLMSTAEWTGVPLGQLLSGLGLLPGATLVAFRSADNYHESYPLELALAPDTLLAHTMNGAPLPNKHGFPLRLVLPGRYGMKSPKWLTRIEVTDQPNNGYWVRRGWDREAGVQTTARIDTPTDQASVPGPRVTVGGVAFAGARGITGVEVSTDGGQSWQQAFTGPPVGPGTWRQWGYVWEAAPVGVYQLMVRTIDGSGALQSAEERPPFPRGASGYHTVHLEVHPA
jgi:DMSO/TMAO reductase YedYZ molybdopterin-dependent catalytic subunit